jgi:uncharacterized RDD family membrane protein YckC
VTGEIMPTMRADPDVASLPRRAAAATLDAMLAFLVLGGGGAAVALRRGTSELSPAQRRVMEALKWVLPAVAVVMRNRRTPGQRLAEIRRVDDRTGGPVSLGAAIARQLYDLVLQLSMRRATRRAIRRLQDNHAELQRRLEEIQAAHAGDTTRIQEETAAVSNQMAANCAGPLVTGLARASLTFLIALRSPRRQTIADRASGTVIVRERRR